MNLKNKKVIITGATGGIGNSLVQKFTDNGSTVLATGTKEQKLDNLKNKFNNIQIEKFNLDEHKNIESFIENASKKLGGLDILVNNAGVLLTGNLFVTNCSTVSDKDIKDTFQTNLFSVISLTQKLLPLIKKSDAGRIVNVSTILSSLTLHSAKDSPIAPAKEFAYNASKTALNAYTIHLALELKDTKIKVNSGHPGWVKTELGGPKAPMEVKDSYKTSLRLATLDNDGPTGGLFHEEDTIPW